MSTNYKDLTQLGSGSAIPVTPEKAILEAVNNPYTDMDYNIRFTCPEFTSLCPLTSAPDFAKIIIDYVPNKQIIESKSLKLFLHSFRNHGDFHEACTLYIAKKIIDKIQPKWLRIGGYWYPRGGIPIDVFFQTAEKPKNIWIPNQKVQTYSARK